MPASFSVTWDYRCPFARNVHEHLLAALDDGAEWDVTFRAFSLDQAHVEDGHTPVWEEPDRYPALIANEAGVVVRDRDPDHFRAVHRALFAARHDHAIDLRERDNVAKVLADVGVDPAAVLAEIDAGWPLEVIRDEHTEAAERLSVFGVPTFIVDDRAVFVRILDRPNGDALHSRRHIERTLDLMGGWPELNEFKYTSIPR